MSADQSRSDSERPREHSGGLEVFSAKVVELADVEVRYSEDEGNEDELLEAEGVVIEAEESEGLMKQVALREALHEYGGDLTIAATGAIEKRAAPTRSASYMTVQMGYH